MYFFILSSYFHWYVTYFMEEQVLLGTGGYARKDNSVSRDTTVLLSTTFIHIWNIASIRLPHIALHAINMFVWCVYKRFKVCVYIYVIYYEYVDKFMEYAMNTMWFVYHICMIMLFLIE